MLLSLPYGAAILFERECAQYLCAPRPRWGGCALTLGLVSHLRVVSVVLPSGCSTWLGMHLQCGLELLGLRLF